MNRDLLTALKDQSLDFEHSLLQFGRNLLELLTSDASIALNRAAIELAPEDTAFSQLLLNHGRNRTMPLFTNLIDRAVKQGYLKKLDKKEAAACFVSLLLGELHHQLLLGVCKRPTRKTLEHRVKQAVANFFILFRLESIQK
jgi:AcrR family transcriptional regulator